jgi:hypothetical protein
VQRAAQKRVKPPTLKKKARQALLIALSSMTDDARHMVFDSDSFLMALDNCSSRMFTNDKKDLIGTPRKVLKDVLGIGKLQICLKGMVMWPFEDDHGVVHKWQFPTYYSPDIGHNSTAIRMLAASPIQIKLHWNGTDTSGLYRSTRQT